MSGKTRKGLAALNPARYIRKPKEPGRDSAAVSGKRDSLYIRIGWKITAVVVAVVLLLGVVNVLFIRGRFESAMNVEFESKARAIAMSIARTGEDKLASRDVGAIQSITDSYKDVRGVNYIVIEDADKNVIAGVFSEGYTEKLKGLNPLEGGEEYKIARFEIEGVGDILEVAVPVLFGRAGAVRVGMDHKFINTELKGITENLFVLFAVASVLGVVVLHLVIAFLLRHVGTILKVLERVKRGDLTARAVVKTHDEFMDLADHLNNTLEQLSAIVDRVDQSYDSIFQATENISRVYNVVQEGIDQQGELASETSESVTDNKSLIDKITGGIHVLENSTNDSFSSIMEMGASIEEVSAMADSLFNSVNESNSAIEELSGSIEKVGENLTSLFGATDETAGAMNEMSASIVEVRSSAGSTSQDAVQMIGLAEEGAEVSRKAREGMSAIKESSALVSQTISLVSERIDEIDEILRFITEITGKTNLLALNAAIIAAQAGTQGKGFGVVADEINELAQSTKAQTNRIADVIEGLRGEVVRASEAVEDSNRKVDGGVRLTEEVTEALEGIMNSTMLVSHKVEEIAQTTAEQADTSSRVLETTQRLAESVGNIKEVGDQQSEAAEKLLLMSKQIQQAAQKVKMSTEEQTMTSQQINKELTRVTETVRTISESIEIQTASGEKVLKTTEVLAGVIRSNRETVHGLQEVIDELTRGMEAMNRDLGIFKTDKRGIK
ncbi:MAG: methyl-accepting chemotaxis protein [Pseudomonadota bacterium]|jgi:methyl-accepting chemotaxis protein